ncbi:acid protease [Massarina eburnea CBS 473.64]|uniref:Acid protease n=1 Tax=Massarina eburnea CBS 473.64 TaxID=1395130 RepID=A0A6A6S4I6_9PLEO|nr:acid protease [Massarina eburnea CBS 473.64]
MFILIYLAFLSPLASCMPNRRAPSQIAVTNYVLPLIAAHHPIPITPSSQHLHKRRPQPLKTAIFPFNSSTNPSDINEAISHIQQDVLTLGGRVYMTNVSLANKEYTLVIDTGSSDTWIASTEFVCLSKYSQTALPQGECGFGTLYDRVDSKTYEGIGGRAFGVRYTDGEFLVGELGRERLGFGGVGVGGEGLKVGQTIGVVERGWWGGDGISSGLMGLAYPTLASNSEELNYTSIVFSLFENDPSIPPIFSLALNRPTIQHPIAGGLLAIGGIPDVKHDGVFISVPIQQVVEDTYAFYSIEVEGFDIAAPDTSPSSSPSQGDSTAASSPSPSISPPSPPTHPPTTKPDPHKKAKAPPAPKPKNKNPHARQITRPPNSSPNSTIIFSPNLTMVIDSGCTLLYIPDDIADRIAALFVPRAVFAANTNTYLVPCFAKPPRVGIVIKGRSFYIHGDDLMNKAPGAVGGGGVGGEGEVGGDGDWDWDEDGGDYEEEGGDGKWKRRGLGEGRLCTLAVQRQGAGDAVLGDSFLKNVLAVFDLGENVMRFAGREEY